MIPDRWQSEYRRCSDCLNTWHLSEAQSCPYCEDAKCELCDGTTEVTCDLCDGYDSIEEEVDGEMTRVDCPQCDGRSFIPCPDCSET